MKLTNEQMKHASKRADNELFLIKIAEDIEEVRLIQQKANELQNRAKARMIEIQNDINSRVKGYKYEHQRFKRQTMQC